MYRLSYGLLCHLKWCTKFAYSLLLYGLLCYLKQSTTECIYLTLPFVMIWFVVLPETGVTGGIMGGARFAGGGGGGTTAGRLAGAGG